MYMMWASGDGPPELLDMSGAAQLTRHSCPGTSPIGWCHYHQQAGEQHISEQVGERSHMAR